MWGGIFCKSTAGPQLTRGMNVKKNYYLKKKNTKNTNYALVHFVGEETQ